MQKMFKTLVIATNEKTSQAEDDILIETSFENSINFERVLSSVENIDLFLHSEDCISVGGTSVEDPNDLNFEYDIDGVTILWKNIGKGLSLDYTRFDLASRVENDMKPIYDILTLTLVREVWMHLGTVWAAS